VTPAGTPPGAAGLPPPCGVPVSGSRTPERPLRWRRALQRVLLGVLLAASTGGCGGVGPGRCLPAARPPAHAFLIIGHRGAPNHTCENTLASFRQALALGANALELDVSVTRDGHLVLWHDARPTLASALRPTGVCRPVAPPQPQPVHTLPWAVFREAYGYEQAGQFVPVTTLAEFVHHFGRDARVQHVFVDLKLPAELAPAVPALVVQAIELLRQYDALAKAVFTSPHAAIVAQLHGVAQRWARATGERVDLAWDTEGPSGLLTGPWPSAVQRNQAVGTRFALWGKPALTLRSARAFVAAEIQRRDAVNATRPLAEAMQVIVWTINAEAELCAMVRLGVDGIITDDPGRLWGVMQRGTRQAP
jgi:glycerophosphoryl diester phosphodiesterase